MRSLLPLVMVCATVVLATCSLDAVTFTPLGDEDCTTPGDEDDNGAADCADPACAAATECLPPPPTCTDDQRNGDETDEDCGGSCPACGDGATCGKNADCASGTCSGQTCRRFASCGDILAAGLVSGDGRYRIDPDGAAGESPFLVTCDMTTDGGGWTRFHWVTGPYPANADPLELALSQCAVDDAICRGRIPTSATPVDFMVKDLGDNNVALWHFDAANPLSQQALGAFRDKLTGCSVAQALWQPYFYNGTEPFCGTGGEGGCDSFAYVDKFAMGCGNTYTGWYLQLDGDTGCYNTAFKMGMTHTGLESMGCEIPDQNFLDDGPTSTDDQFGELYYR